MQINMQIVLSQGDIENAVRAYLRQEVPISEGQDINVAFDFGGPDEVAVVAVVGGSATKVIMTNTARAGESEEQHAARRERGKPSPGRARRTQAEIAEDEAADAADRAAAGETQTEAPATTAVSEDISFPVTTADTSAVDPAIMAQLGETVDNDPPFDVDSTTVHTTAQVDAITTPAKTSSIFPSADSSAPAITRDDPPPAPPVANGAKSLFANLGSPSVN